VTKGAPGVVFQIPVVGHAGGDPSIKFSLEGTESLGGPKRLVNSDAEDGIANSIPRLIRVRSYDLPFILIVHEGFQRTGDLRRFEVPGGNRTTRTAGTVELVAYGGIKTAAYAIQDRAVVDAEIEILPNIGHVPMLPSFSDQVSLDPSSSTPGDPGDWTTVGALSSGWQPGGRPNLDLVTFGGPIEFGFFSSAVSPVLIASFTVDGILVGGTTHPAPYQLMARHPGGDADNRTAIATWTRGSG
jgi:hypothetical protein